MSGKGSSPRPYSVSQDKFGQNFDAIFRRAGSEDRPQYEIVQPKHDEVLRFEAHGDVYWRGRKIEGDDEFREAMVDLAKSMRELRTHRRCPACGSDVL